MTSPTDEAIAVLRRHIAALNDRDEEALIATLHFPHFRLSGVDLRIWDTADDYFHDFKQRAGGDWSHTKLGDVTEQRSEPHKVHLDVEIIRMRADDSVNKRFHSLWVFTQERGIWAAKFRSSFAGD